MVGRGNFTKNGSAGLSCPPRLPLFSLPRCFFPYLATKGFLVNAMLLQDIRPHTINHAFWSIAVEWHIYFFFPLLVFCWHRVGPRTTLLCTFAVAYTLFFARGKTSWIGITPWYLGLFALGMYAAGSTGTPKSENTREGHWGIVAGLFALFAALLFGIFGWQWTMNHYALVDLPVGICTVVFASRPPSYLSFYFYFLSDFYFAPIYAGRELTSGCVCSFFDNQDRQRTNRWERSHL